MSHYRSSLRWHCTRGHGLWKEHRPTWRAYLWYDAKPSFLV